VLSRDMIAVERKRMKGIKNKVTDMGGPAFFFLNGKYNIYKNLISVQDEQRSEKEATNKGAVYMRNTNDNTKTDNA
jgi:hypothetical protein